MRHIQQRLATCTVLVTALATSACTAHTSIPADAYTARVAINNEQLPETYSVECTQVNWFWTIETLPKSPGFSAIIQTGGTIAPKVFRMDDLAGFTGSSYRATSDSQAGIKGTTFHISGTALGSFTDRPTRQAEVQFRMDATC